MKRRKIVGLASALFFSGVIEVAASAECLEWDGYMYVWASCVQDRTSDPKNACETGTEDNQIETVYFVSRIVHDGTDDNEFPETHFYTALGKLYGLSLNGQGSACLLEKSDVRQDRDEFIAELRRKGHRVVDVPLRSY